MIDADWKGRTGATAHKELATLAIDLNRDCRWLERELKRIAQARALSADKLREIAAESVEKAKKRRARTMER